MSKPHEKQQILIVEDEPLVALYLRDLLAELGYEALGPAADAGQAHRLLAQHTPAIAILDVRGITAGSLVGELRARNIATVVCSGLRSEDLPAELADAPLVPKPVDEGGLADVLAKLAQR